jgi:hypothetical protein
VPELTTTSGQGQAIAMRLPHMDVGHCEDIATELDKHLVAAALDPTGHPSFAILPIGFQARALGVLIVESVRKHGVSNLAVTRLMLAAQLYACAVVMTSSHRRAGANDAV